MPEAGKDACSSTSWVEQSDRVGAARTARCRHAHSMQGGTEGGDKIYTRMTNLQSTMA